MNAPCAKPLIESTVISSDLRMLDSSAVIRHFRQGGEATARLEALAGLFLRWESCMPGRTAPHALTNTSRRSKPFLEA